MKVEDSTTDRNGTNTPGQKRQSERKKERSRRKVVEGKEIFFVKSKFVKKN